MDHKIALNQPHLPWFTSISVMVCHLFIATIHLLSRRRQLVKVIHWSVSVCGFLLLIFPWSQVVLPDIHHQSFLAYTLTQIHQTFLGESGIWEEITCDNHLTISFLVFMVIHIAQGGYMWKRIPTNLGSTIIKPRLCILWCDTTAYLKTVWPSSKCLLGSFIIVGSQLDNVTSGDIVLLVELSIVFGRFTVNQHWVYQWYQCIGLAQHSPWNKVCLEIFGCLITKRTTNNLFDLAMVEIDASVETCHIAERAEQPSCCRQRSSPFDIWCLLHIIVWPLWW